jgi:methionyl-tRNA synthetase
LDYEFLGSVKKNYDAIFESYYSLDFREAVKKILFVSSMANKYLQDNAPWKIVNTDKEKAHKILNTAANVVKDVCIMLKPVMPVFTEQLEKQLNLENLQWNDLKNNVAAHNINQSEIIIRKIEAKPAVASQNAPAVQEKKQEVEKMEEPKPLEKIGFDRLNIRVGQVMSVENHPNADKLMLLQIDLGTEQRRIVAGLRGHYTNDYLVGKKLCIVTNLERNKLRGIESEAMLLAGSTEDTVGILYAEQSELGDQVYIDGIMPCTPDKIITFKEFGQIPMFVKNGKPTYEGKPFRTEHEHIKVEKAIDGMKVR